MILTWATTGATEVWIGETTVASAAGDPKTTPGSAGPLPPSGSTTLPFNCANSTDYFVIGVYNGTVKGGGEVHQVQRNI